MFGTEILTFLVILSFVAYSLVLVKAESHYVYNTIKCDGGSRCSGLKTGESVQLEERRCLDKWVGCKCDQPTCTPKCEGDQVCIDINRCECLRPGKSVGSNCFFVRCWLGEKLDCYPGTCDENGTNCRCPTQWGFTGKNCLQITKTPDITSCSIEIQSGGTTAGMSSCLVDGGFSPPVTWINAKVLDRVVAKWIAKYENPTVLPSGMTYLVRTPVVIGVVETLMKVLVVEKNISRTEEYVDSTMNIQNPPPTVTCFKTMEWDDIGSGSIEHNQTIRVTVTGKLGGQKQVKNGTVLGETQYFNGTEVTRSAYFKVDQKPPKHCLQLFDPSQCPYFPIYLDQDIRQDKTIDLRFYNWTDDGSGIEKFVVQIFSLKINDDLRKLDTVGSPLTGSTKTIKSDSTDFYQFSMTDEGIYSIEVTVFDRAGNSVKARKIFIYNPNPSLNLNPNSPIYLAQASSQSNVTWLTYFQDSRDGSYIPLTVVWKDHFQSSAKFKNEWAMPVVEWPSDNQGAALIDDKYGQRYGRRSIAQIASVNNGIASFAVSYMIDYSGGGKGISPSTWIPLSSTNTSYNLPINSALPDGTAIAVWVQATDAAFGSVVERLNISVDRSPPEVRSQSYQLKTGTYQTNTTVSINVADPHSGISKITYRIIIGDSAVLYVRDVGPKTRTRPNPRSKRDNNDVVKACETSDRTCYCIPLGDCFDYIQTIDINNCDIDRFSGQSFSIRYTVTNLANLVSIEQTIDLGFKSADDIPCRDRYRLSGGAIAGIVIGVILGFLLLILLILILILLVRIYYFKKPMPQRIDRFGKTIRRSVGRNLEEENAAYETQGAFSAVTKKISVKLNKNKKYQDVDDEYIYTGSEAVRNNSTHVQRKNLQIDETISNEGRFAVIKKGYLQDGNERKIVAVKALRSGFSGSDVRLMEDKILFLQDVPRHSNIVNFIGASEEENNGGPIMILEYCGIPLKDWLKQQKKVTSEVLEQMLDFTLNIARGVEHLHANEIVHRRLAVRNVLLTQQANGLVAKLIGFGPNREDSGDGAKKVAVPVKWLSPETLQTINNQDPTYNKKTDVWSFGITIWEIYSLGNTPYPDKSSNDAKKLIIKGLKPTKPDECPPELYQTGLQPCWETNPNSRPDMSRICSAIVEFRSGSSGQGGQGYYTTEDDYGAQDYGRGRSNEGYVQELYDDGR